MEGRVSEEPKSVQAVIYSSRGQMSERSESERKRVEKNQVFEVQSGVDASNEPLGGNSESHQVGRERGNEMHVSRVQSGVDASNEPVGGDSESHQVKRKRGNEMHVSRVQSGVDASNEPVGGDSESHQAEHKRGTEMHVSRMKKGKGQNVKHSTVHDRIPPRFQGITLVSVELEYAKIALEYYEKRQDAKFEILEVLFSNRATLVVPGFKGVGQWCHVSFIAKPKNSDCCGEHFFGEMVFDRDSKNYKVTYCSIFEPSDPGNVNGCVFCPASEIYLHPADGCPAGGREIDNFMAQNGADASQGQMRGCSKRHHRGMPEYLIWDDDASKMIENAEKAINLRYAKIALEFFEKSKDAEFEIVEVLQSICSRVVVPGSRSIEEWCHVSFIAKPRNTDCTNFTPKHFFGELLHDTTTGKYSATYCEIFKPSDRRVTHNCIICPQLWKHPFKGYCVGRPPYSIAEDSFSD